jgi:predicted PurR-regulated permease PerM
VKNQINVNITPKSVALVLLTLIAIYFVSSVIGLVFLFILAYILATALNPMTRWFHKIGIPLTLSSLFVILIFLLPL